MKTDHKILFFTYNFSGAESRGGAEIRAYRTALALRTLGRYKIFHAFKNGDVADTRGAYDKTIKLERSRFIPDLADFLKENEVEVIINEGDFYRHDRIRKAIKKSGRNIKMLFVHHVSPGSELLSSRPGAMVRAISNGENVGANLAQLAIHPLYYMWKLLGLKKLYKKIYKQTDGVILWSTKYIPGYKKMGGFRKDKKFYVIPGFIPVSRMSNYLNKENRVLVLSRLDETYKKISYALKIWKRLESEGHADDWTLDIVGDGPDLKRYKKLAKKLGLKNVEFHGWQPREKFFQQSSIYIMTSKKEGMGLSLLEAMSYGCVPVAFHSFAAISDAIDDNQNGFLVEDFGDTKTFAKEMVNLMKNRRQREFMSSRAMYKSQTYNSVGSARKWVELLDYISPQSNA
ncbi:MAG: glycosyltransferase [Muribaculaceae bacterium]|nr:glycosyltransferase [Muribaculaceae bacterium]